MAHECLSLDQEHDGTLAPGRAMTDIETAGLNRAGRRSGGNRYPSPLERFEAAYEPEPTSGCWLWFKNRMIHGYGRFSVEDKDVLAHRWSYEHFIGPIPTGLTLDNLCRNRSCVNPNHLEPVTNRENILRGEGITAKNACKTYCLRGHPFDDLNTYHDKGGGRRCKTCMRLCQRLDWRG